MRTGSGWVPEDPAEAPIQVLRSGAFQTMRLTPYGTNETLDCEIAMPDGQAGRAIYKPMRGEAPLWDFPIHTLFKREYAAYLLSKQLGWHIVPFTLIRDGPRGVGSVQLYVDHDPADHFFTLRQTHADDFRQFAAFDIVANNADRKSTHCLLDAQGRVWSIDHGITFNVEYKLRTVIWDYAGEPVPAMVLEDLKKLDQTLAAKGPFAREMRELLSGEELDALGERVRRLLQRAVFPGPDPHRRSYPWPMV